MRSKPTLKLLISFVMLGMLACNSPEKNKLVLPIFGAKFINKGDTVYHTLSDFSLTNQYGETVTKATLRNKIVVANFFFATCQSICPEMSNNLTDVQSAFAKDDSLLILSHTVNPGHDTVEVLLDYSERYGAAKNKWHFLTGSKDTIYALAKNSYLVNAIEDDGSQGGFLHSELFLLVDTKSRIRGMYDGTSKPDVQKLIADIKLLKTEKEN